MLKLPGQHTERDADIAGLISLGQLVQGADAAAAYRQTHVPAEAPTLPPSPVADITPVR